MKCPSCENTHHHKTIKNYDLISNKYFDILECDRCNLNFTNFNHSKDKIENYYPKEYYGDQNKRFSPIFELMIKCFRLLRILYTFPYFKNNKNSNVLDIGCGRGYFLFLVKKIFKINVMGVELSDLSATYAKKHLKLNIVSTLEDIQNQKFQTMTMWHSLEHMLMPKYILTKAHQLLEDKGHIIIEVPNLKSLQRKLAKNKWIYLESPRHITHFDDQSLKHLLDDSGFKVLTKSSFSIEYGFFGMLDSILSFLGFEQTALFMAIRNNTAKINTPNFIKKIFILLMASILFPLAVILEFYAIFRKQGGILRVVAVKK